MLIFSALGKVCNFKNILGISLECHTSIKITSSFAESYKTIKRYFREGCLKLTLKNGKVIEFSNLTLEMVIDIFDKLYCLIFEYKKINPDFKNMPEEQVNSFKNFSTFYHKFVTA